MMYHPPIFRCDPFWRCYRLVSRDKVIENQIQKVQRLLTLPSTPTPSHREHFGELARSCRTVDEDEREHMFIQIPDPDYVPEPIYPEYIPLDDEHVFPAEEQPLPPVALPTAESPRYVSETDPEEDLEEYDDDESEDGTVDYPMDGGDA
ncbi:hypothetical protein Tco_0980512, partial [Tanacetum coccineum]